MRNRITWQNVAAPSFRDAIAATRQAGDSFSAGFRGLANIAGDIRAGQQERASQEAITQALGITDAGEFANIMSNQGLNGFGVTAGDLTSQALEFFAGRGTDLTNQAQTRAQTNRSNLLAEQTQYNLDRDRTLDPLKDAQAAEDREFTLQQRARTLAEQERADQTRAIQTEALGIANTIMDGNVSRDEATRLAANLSRQNGWSPQLEDAVWKEIQGKDDAQFAVDPMIAQTFMSDQNLGFGELSRGIDAQRAQLDMARSADGGVRLYTEAQERYGGVSDPLQKLLENTYGDQVSADATSEERGDIRGTFNDLKRENPSLSPEIIVMAMENSKRPNLLGYGNREVISKKDAQSLLDQLSTPEALNRVVNTVNGFNARQETIDTFDKQMQRLLDKASRAQERGDANEVDRHTKAVQDLLAAFAQATTVTAPAAPSDSGSSAGSEPQRDAGFMNPRAGGTAEEIIAAAAEQNRTPYDGPALINDPNIASRILEGLIYELRGGSIYDR